MMQKLINALHLGVTRDHPEFYENRKYQPGTRVEAIDRHRFGLHTSITTTAIMRRNIDLILLVEDQSPRPRYMVSLYLPLSKRKFALMSKSYIVTPEGAQISCGTAPEENGKPLHYIAAHMVLAHHDGVKAYFDAIDHMTKELAKAAEEHLPRGFSEVSTREGGRHNDSK